jgi:DNA sulfur modification protein DndC
MHELTGRKKGAFSDKGLAYHIDILIEEIQELYKFDKIPWVVGYSGGKDSTATLQLVWMAISKLSSSERHKPIYVISTDTLVENPVVSSWVDSSLECMRNSALEQNLPIQPHKLVPETTNSFWVNLIGRGYPAPRPRFRWCTERLKIDPAAKFITSVVQQNGEAIVVLGTRKAESSARARVMNRLETQRLRDHLSPNVSLPNSFVYSPIENWSNDDVWLFLMQYKNPWGYRNKDLLTMYQGASPDGECPLVVDTSTPSCGDSRFGCWVCTLVEKDKSMTAMIQNDDEKAWMIPLLELRNSLDYRTNESQDDRHLRDFRRMNGAVQLYNDRPVPGPYTQMVRESWLRKLLRAQQLIRENGPEGMKNIQLIQISELEEIRRIWVIDKHEIEDLLPCIYEECTGEDYPGIKLDDSTIFSIDEMNLLKEICDGDDLHYQLVRELISVEKRYSSMFRRAGMFDAIEKAFTRNFYSDVNDAVDRARRKYIKPNNSIDELSANLEPDGFIQEATLLDILEKSQDN